MKALYAAIILTILLTVGCAALKPQPQPAPQPPPHSAPEAVVEDKDDSAFGIDTGSSLVNDLLYGAILTLAGYFGIRQWRGTPGHRKGRSTPIA